MSDTIESQMSSPNFLKLKSELLKHPDGMALYEDPNFPANYDILFHKPNKEFNTNDIIWRRPGQLSKLPCLMKFNNDQSTSFHTGKLSPFWFPVLISLLNERNMFELVVPNISNQNTFNQEPFIITPVSMSYCGTFQFTFRRGGKLDHVIIDDRLPTTVSCHMLSVSSNNNEEFLPALIEKAYAKFLGGYYCLEKETLFSAIMDFTGVLGEFICKSVDEKILSEHITTFYQKVVNMTKESFGICQIESPPPINKRSPAKGPPYHVYIITGFTEIPLDPPDGLVNDLLNQFYNSRGSLIPVVRLMPLSDSDENGVIDQYVVKTWKKCTTLVKKKYGLECNNGKELWITVEKVLEISKCSVLFHMFNRNSIIALAKKQLYWKYVSFDHFWQRDGPRRGPKIIGQEFLKNNQYMIMVPQPESCCVKIVLTNVQKYVERGANVIQTGGNTQIGIELFEVEKNRLYRVHNLDHTKALTYQTDFQQGRYLVITAYLERGRYVVVPWISAGSGTKYTLQVFSSDSRVETTFLELDIPEQQLCAPCQIKQTAYRTQNRFKSLYDRTSSEYASSSQRKISTIQPEICKECREYYPKRATRISVLGAKDIRLTATYQLPNFFFKISCENELYLSNVVSSTLSPQWNEHFLFYRVNNDFSEVNIQLFCENKLGLKSRIFNYIFSEKELRDKCRVSLPIQEEINPESESDENRIIIEIENYFLSEFNGA